MTKPVDDWSLRVPTISIHPDSASLAEVARLAAELMALRHVMAEADVALIAAGHALRSVRAVRVGISDELLDAVFDVCSFTSSRIREVLRYIAEDAPQIV